MKKVIGISLSLMMLLTGFFSVLALQIGKNKNNNTTINQEVIYNASALETTGASTAELKYKGGAVFVAKGQTYQMTGNELSGHSKTYGGAVYVANGGKFIMTAGVIENNSANYGGAVYIERGGTFEFKGGIIRNNSAVVAPAVYVENGATFKQSGNAKLENNYLVNYFYQISEDTVKVGHYENGSDMHYVEWGTYPQTFAGYAELSNPLEKWYQEAHPTCVKTYITTHDVEHDYGIWYAYEYTEPSGVKNLYVRGNSKRCDHEALGLTVNEPYFRYEDIVSTVPEEDYTPVWFKVEPIKWVILNYEDVVNGSASFMQLLAYQGIASNVVFNTEESNDNNWETSIVRNWCNNTFLNNAFSDIEKNFIISKTIYNNSTDVYIDDIEKKTVDKVYLMSFQEVNNNIYLNNENKLLCSPTDFTMSNECCKSCEHFESNIKTVISEGGTCCWFLRSAGRQEHLISYGHFYSYIQRGSDISSNFNAIRPVINLRLDLRSQISEEEINVGGVNSGVNLHYMYYGSYPQTFVGKATDNTQLINGLNLLAETSAPRKYYSLNYGNIVWKAYLYSDGNYYARGESSLYIDKFSTPPYKYRNGQYIPTNDESSEERIVWFKVEPIKWLVINYSAVMNGTADTINLLSYEGLTASTNFYHRYDYIEANCWETSDLRNWLNENFLFTAFNSEERTNISLKTIYNNPYGNDSSDSNQHNSSLIVTRDKVYCLSRDEVVDEGGVFTNRISRLCSPTDFAMSNNVFCLTSEGHETDVYDGTSHWWLRTAGTLYYLVNYSDVDGFVAKTFGIESLYVTVRPAISLII